MKITTFNLRCVYRGDGINSFVHRAVPLCDKINEEKPDVIAFQEVTVDSLRILEKLLTEYILVGQMRGENYDVEGLYTAVRKETCQLLGFETIWLSPTPYVPGSRYEHQSKFPRICLQTMIRHRDSGKVIRFFNLHLEHIVEEAKLNGVHTALDFAEEFERKGNYPFVILGDFNSTPESEVIKICIEKKLCDVTKIIPVSFHEFKETNEKIDYIFMPENLAGKVKKVEVWEEEENGIYLSDHYPICAELKL